MLGDSIVRWAGERAKQKNLKFAERSVIWDGRSGMKVKELHSAIQHGILKGYKPKIIIVHLGGNDITSSNTCQIISVLTKSLEYLFSVFSNSMIVWTNILPRLRWRNTPNTPASAKTMDLKRKRINRKMRQITLQHELGRTLNHQAINRDTPGFYHSDGVHLSDVGIEMYLLSLEQSISSFFKNKTCKELNLG